MLHIHAVGDDALGDSDAVGLVERLRAREVSPAELVEAAIARAEAVNPQLNGLAFEGFDRARTSARQDGGVGYFAGVPTVVKDNVDVAGMPTMQGTDAWQPHPANADGDFARLYRRAGLIPLGKSQLSEFGFNAAAEHPRLGAVRNPWNIDYTAGASSSGSAAFVAAGVVPIAHANDGGGSIRIPAACNGLVGLKPSRGRLPLDKDFRAMPIRVVYNGVLTRSVRDTVAFYAEAERISRNTALPAIGDIRQPAARRLKIAVLTESLARDISPTMCELTVQTATLLEGLGHHVDYLGKPPVPAHFADDFLLYWGLLAAALVKGGRWKFGPTFDRARLDNLTLGLNRYASRHAHRIPLATARLAGLRRHTARMFANYDVVLSPTVGHETPRVGHFDPTADYAQIIDRLMDWVAFTPLHNVSGEPAISLPVAQSADGLPVGMMFSAPLGRDGTLLELAYELEAAKPWPRIAGPVA